MARHWFAPERMKFTMRTHYTTSLNTRSQGGTTLIETMVALLILSIGLLGIAALQMSGLFQNRVGYERSQAVMLADEIAERIRVNRPAAAAGDYDTAIGTVLAAPSGTCLGQAANCTPGTLATEDLGLWKQRLDQILAGGDGAVLVTVAGSVARSARITIQWPPANSFTIDADLN